MFCPLTAEGEPHPEQLLPADVVLVLPETRRRVSGNRNHADPQPPHVPTHSARAGQVGLHVRLHGQDRATLQTERGPHHRPGAPLPAGAIRI